MATLLPYITSGLRFPAEDILCKGDRWRSGCAAADGEAAYAIHTFEGHHYCAYHSPFDNVYAPCVECGEKPALANTGDAALCDDCLAASNRVTEYDYYLAMTGAHDLRHPNRPAPADLPASDYTDAYPANAAGHVCDEAAERAAYTQYVSDGLADTDGRFTPESFEAWQAHYHREVGHKEPRAAECTDSQCNAPQHEQTRRLNSGTARKPRYESLCPACYKPRAAAIVAARRAA